MEEYIPLEECKTPGAITHWLLHIASKGRYSSSELGDLVAAFYDLLDIRFDEQQIDDVREHIRSRGYSAICGKRRSSPDERGRTTESQIVYE